MANNPRFSRSTTGQIAPVNNLEAASVAQLGITDLKQEGRSHDEICEMVDSTRWAMGMTWKEIQQLSRFLDPYSAAAGRTIFREGALEAYLCLLIEGTVKIVKEDSTDGEKTLAEILAGKTFGEMSLVDGEPRSAGAVALLPCVVLVMTRASLERLNQESPKLAGQVIMKIARLMSQRLRMTTGLLVEYLEGNDP